MKAATLIFPHQLFKTNPAIDKSRPVYLVEEFLFFRQYNFHRQKLVLHRASMKAYTAFLQNKKQEVFYIDAQEQHCDIKKLIPWLAKKGINEIHYTDTVDNWLEKRIQTGSRKSGITIHKYATPNFLNQLNDVKDFFDKKKTYFQTDFYIQQRKQRKLLLEGDGKPIGGKWTFDTENRLKFPKKETILVIAVPKETIYVKEAKGYVNTNFAGNYGNADSFTYPVTFTDSEKWLDDFF